MDQARWIAQTYAHDPSWLHEAVAFGIPDAVNRAVSTLHGAQFNAITDRFREGVLFSSGSIEGLARALNAWNPQALCDVAPSWIPIDQLDGHDDPWRADPWLVLLRYWQPPVDPTTLPCFRLRQEATVLWPPYQFTRLDWDTVIHLANYPTHLRILPQHWVRMFDGATLTRPVTHHDLETIPRHAFYRLLRHHRTAVEAGCDEVLSSAIHHDLRACMADAESLAWPHIDRLDLAKAWGIPIDPRLKAACWEWYQTLPRRGSWSKGYAYETYFYLLWTAWLQP